MPLGRCIAAGLLPAKGGAAILGQGQPPQKLKITMETFSLIIINFFNHICISPKTQHHYTNFTADQFFSAGLRPAKVAKACPLMGHLPFLSLLF